MRRFVLLAGIFTFFSLNLLAQEESVMDSVMLDEITTIAVYKKYQAGAKIESISTDQLEISQEGGIENVLMRFTPIYLKSNAGGLSSIHLRGTSATHTSVNFGGININSLSLGSLNMSSVSSYLFDEIDLQYGSSSAVNGSGAVGGALFLGFQNNWTDGLKLKAKTTQGSFGEQLYGTKVFIGNGKWESVTRMYYYGKKNNFPFINPYNNDAEDRQHGARIENMGLIQELNYRFSEDEYFKSAVWLEHDWYQVQPNMQSNLSYNGTSALTNKHIRVWSEYLNNKHEIKYHAGLGYVHDMQLYDNDETQKIGSDRFVGELEANQDISETFGYKAGVKYRYIVPNVYAYSDSVIDLEQNLETYLSSFFTFKKRLKLTLNLRQMYVTNFSVPFTPSLGAEYRLFIREKSVMKLTSNVARSYRVPTFNDRYWGTQGNPNLKPEKGMNYELGLDYNLSTESFDSEIKLNAFYMDIKNWIEWRMGAVDWTAQNVMRVVSKGIEFQSISTIYLDKFILDVILNYNYNPVSVKKDDDNPQNVGKQVIYVPKHNGNAYLMLKYKLWSTSFDGSYTGMRFSDHSGSIYNPDGFVLDDYLLINYGLSRKIKTPKQEYLLAFSVNNIFNINYQNERFYAMLGRSFRISVSTDLNFNINY